MGDTISAPVKIPEKLASEILDMQAEGKTAQVIADWLKDKYNIDVKSGTVSLYLRNRKEERKEIAKAQYAKAVAAHANKDLKIVDNTIDTLNKAFLKQMAAGDDKTANMTAKTLHTFINFRAGLSGIDTKEAKEETNTEQTLDDIFNKLGSNTSSSAAVKNN